MKLPVRSLLVAAFSVTVVLAMTGAAADVRLLAASATVAAFALLVVYVLTTNGRPRSLIGWLPIVGVGGLLIATLMAGLTTPAGADGGLSDAAVDEATWLAQAHGQIRRALMLELTLAVSLIIGCVSLLVGVALPGNPGRLRRPLPALLAGICALLVAAIAGLVIWNLVDSAPAANQMDRAERLLSIAATVPRLVALLAVATAAAFVVDRAGSFDLTALAGSALLVVSAAQPVLLRGSYPVPHRPDTIYAIVGALGTGVGVDRYKIMFALVPLAGAALLILVAMRRARGQPGAPTAPARDDGA